MKFNFTSKYGLIFLITANTIKPSFWILLEYFNLHSEILLHNKGLLEKLLINEIPITRDNSIEWSVYQLFGRGRVSNASNDSRICLL